MDPFSCPWLFFTPTPILLQPPQPSTPSPTRLQAGAFPPWSAHRKPQAPSRTPALELLLPRAGLLQPSSCRWRPPPWLPSCRSRSCHGASLCSTAQPWWPPSSLLLPRAAASRAAPWARLLLNQCSGQRSRHPGSLRLLPWLQPLPFGSLDAGVYSPHGRIPLRGTPRRMPAPLSELSPFLPWRSSKPPWTPPVFLPRAAVGSPCSASCHSVQVFCAAVPIQKNSNLGSPLHRVLRSICAVPIRAVAMVFETAPCSVADLRRACESSSKILGEPLASIPLFLDLKCLIKMFEPLSDVNRS
jgi:hypothetical protein